MPSLAERVKAAETAAAQRAADQRQLQADNAAQEKEAAYKRFLVLLAEQLGIDQFDQPNFEMVRLRHHQMHSGDHTYDFLALNLDGYWLGIRVAEDTHESNMRAYAQAALNMLVVCPNQHVTEHHSFYTQDQADYYLARIGSEMAAAAAQGGCYQCIKEGIQASLTGELQRRISTSTRAARAVAASLLSDYLSEEKLRKALAAAEEATLEATLESLVEYASQ